MQLFTVCKYRNLVQSSVCLDIRTNSYGVTVLGFKIKTHPTFTWRD
jgi:hypothetical protein